VTVVRAYHNRGPAADGTRPPALTYALLVEVDQEVITGPEPEHAEDVGDGAGFANDGLDIYYYSPLFLQDQA
jgi:hypothetical protein